MLMASKLVCVCVCVMYLGCFHKESIYSLTASWGIQGIGHGIGHISHIQPMNK